MTPRALRRLQDLRRQLLAVAGGTDAALDVSSAAYRRVCRLRPDLLVRRAGKTTAVRILTTLLKPDAGEVIIAGHDALREPQKAQAVIGIAGQAVSVDDKLTGLENLTMFGRLCRLSKKGSRFRAASLLEQFGLAQAAKLPVKSYSGGMRRKLDLAASLLVAPPVLFLDEPTSGLDPASRAALSATISELAQGGSTEPAHDPGHRRRPG